MITACFPSNESERLAALDHLKLLDTDPESRFDVVTRLTARLMGAPMALVSLVDAERQWFKSRVGLDATQTSRDIAFCAHAILNKDVLVVPDATQDERFFDNPLVTGELGLRAYAGMPVHTTDGFPIGTLCVLDKKPRQFSDDELASLRDLAELVEREIRANEDAARWKQVAQQSLASAEERDRLYYATVDWAGIGIGLVNLEGTWQRVNPRLAEILGGTAKSLNGLACDQSIDPQQKNAFRHFMNDVLLSRADSRTIQVKHILQDQRIVWTEITVTLLHDAEGQPLSMVVLIDDITQKRATELALQALHEDLENQIQQRTEELRQAKERAEESNAAKSRFLSNMSHELRTPLNAVLGYAHRLSRSTLQPEQRSDLQKLQVAGQTLLGLVSDVLDISKIEAGEFQMANERFDLEAMLRDLEDMLSDSASQKQLAFRIGRLPSEMSSHYWGDSLRLRQILVNLIGNAIKFTDQGHVELRMMPPQASGGDRVRIRFEVEDTGVGINAEKLKQVFDRFKQVDEGYLRRHSGSGLGLAIVKELAERMGGKVDVVSVAGSGSTFGVEIELTAADAVVKLADNAGSTKLVANQPRLQGIKILLVDDNPSNLDIATGILLDEEAEIFVCTNGQAAIDWLSKPGHVADIVLMDVHMPVMDGNTAVSRIRQDEKLAVLPVIAMTASITLTDRQQSINAGMTDYVTKPVQSEQLIETLLRYV